MVGGKWPFELKPAFYEPERFLREQAEVEVALMVPRRSGERGAGVRAIRTARTCAARRAASRTRDMGNRA